MDSLKLESSKLLPELKTHVQYMDKIGMLCLKHPLVYSVPYIPHQFIDDHLNGCFHQKTRAIKRALNEEDYSYYVFLHERPWRINAFLDVPPKIDNFNYWNLLGHIFVDSENLFENFKIWCELLKSQRPCREALMDSSELQKLESLPEQFTVYRGLSHRFSKKDGLSFTIDLSKAEWFSTRYKGQGVVYSGTIEKKDVLAYFGSRNESEIVALPGRVKNLQRIIWP